MDEIARIIANNILDTEYSLMYQTIKDAGLWEEFINFSNKYPLCTMEVFEEFGKLHPEKFHVIDKEEQYGHFVCFSKDHPSENHV